MNNERLEKTNRKELLKHSVYIVTTEAHLA